MLIGKYWGSAEHRKIITEEKKEILLVIKDMTNEYLLNPNDTLKKKIDFLHNQYRKLVDYTF